jgi:hypothetical protein
MLDVSRVLKDFNAQLQNMNTITTLLGRGGS